MAQKDKAKTEGVKKEKVNKSGVSKPLVIISLFVILVAAVSYQAYVTVTTIPELPEFDLNVWWGPNATKQDTSIRPYRILFTDSMEEHIRKKFEVHRFNTEKKKSLTESWSYGINYDAFAQVFAHWQFKYTIRERVRLLNQFDQFKTNIQGIDIHFVHVKPKVEKNVQVLPLLLLHGWPGSIREFYDAIPLLTKARPGYDFVFEIIAPSLPGFIFSDAPTKPGLGPHQAAITMRNLMHRLGFKNYFVQGGDFGHSIGSHMATIFPDEVLGFHSSFPVNFSKWAFLTWILGGICPSCVGKGLVDRMYPVKDKVEFTLEESGYMHLQGTKPDTIGVALTDSPVGLAAYIIDRFMIFTDPNNKNLEDGGLSKYYSTNSLLDQVMLYWVSNSITTALRFYKESFVNAEVEQILAQIPTPVPVWGLRTKHELAHHPDFILRWKYPNLLGTTTLDFGGHFIAFERPKEFVKDVFEGVKRILEFNSRNT